MKLTLVLNALIGGVAAWGVVAKWTGGLEAISLYVAVLTICVLLSVIPTWYLLRR